MFAGVGLLFAAGGAAAQTIDDTDFGLPQFYDRGKNISVTDRDQPDYDEVGVHAGGFTLMPKVEIDGVYSSNLLATPNNPRADVGYDITPSISAQSNWSRHSLFAYASVSTEDFSRSPSEDQTTWSLQSIGRLDVYGDSYMTLGADVDRYVEPRGATTTQAYAATPVSYDTEGVYYRGLYSADRLRASVDADFRNFSYLNVPFIGGGTIDEGLRDYYQTRVGGRIDYALTPDLAVFTRVIEAIGEYEQGPASERRNFDDTKVLAGANFDITALARGEIGFGYIEHHYTSSTYQSLGGAAVSAKVEYFPTQLFTVTAIAQRLVGDAAFSTASGYFEDVATLTGDYEFKRNIILSTVLGYEQDEFQGIRRTDLVYSFKETAKYLVNHNIGLGATIAYTDRNSLSAPVNKGPIYDETRFTLSLVFQR